MQQDIVEAGCITAEAIKEQERSASEADEEGNSSVTWVRPGSDG